jgi:2,4-dienoyl-CoA reductase-like NADH-dependent reductase (Old Yellow Enzyme family)
LVFDRFHDQKKGVIMATAQERYPKLFSPIQVGTRELPNRLIMAPLYTGYATMEGRLTPYLVEHYRMMGASGLAMVVVESVAVTAGDMGSLRTIRAHDDDHIEDLAQLAQAIHEGSALACCQINHPGRFALLSGPVGPSPVEVSGMMPRELTAPEIRELVQAYAAAARRVKQAGFDMVELHGGTGYLLASFVSPRTNQRTDAYGGSLEARMRFPLEVLEATREAVGQEFPVGYRFLVNEWLPGGFEPPEDQTVAQALEKGGIAYLSVMGGTYESFFLPEVIERSAQDGYMSDLAGRVKQAVSVPVVTAGRITNPGLAERILDKDQADMIGLARMILTDPDWVRKAREGREAEILECRTGCDAGHEWPGRGMRRLAQGEKGRG